MSDYQERLRNTAPTSLLTLVALVQAITLERLVERVAGLRELDPSIPELVGCLAAAVMLLEGIVIIWIVYSQVFCVIRWVPTRAEPFAVFAFGVLQLTVIALLEPSTLWIGMLIYGTATAMMVAMNRRVIRAFGQIPENASALALLPMSSFGNLSLVHGGLCALAGLVGAFSQMGSSVLLLLTIATNAAILASWSTGWWRVMQQGPQPGAALRVEEASP